MNKFRIWLMTALVPVFILTGCADPELQPIITFDQAGKGAYVRLISQSDALINLFDVAGSSYTYSVEFVDLEKGALVSQYILDLAYEDNNADNGDASTLVSDWKVWNAGDFETNADGFKGLSNITISGPEAISGAGTTEADVRAGDNFKVIGRLVMQDGSVHNFSNSSSSVNGAAFRGHFNFTLPAGCPSDLTGSYAYASSDIWCNGGTATGSVDIIALGGGEYTFSDWAFGGYVVCYGGGNAGNPQLTFNDVCAEVSPNKVVDSFGDTWTYPTWDITGNAWTIGWENTYGESGVGVVSSNGAEWGLTAVN